MNDLVSVIIPIYNTEAFLERCLDSVINQSFKNLQIIVLLDGSKDGSEEIVDCYSQVDPRIEKYTHNNIGLGPTRNRGITKAKGKYLVFVDSDDFIENQMVEQLYTHAEASEADITCCETFLLRKGEKRIRKEFNQKNLVTLTTENIEDFMRKFYYTNKYSHNAVDKLYRKDFVISNNLVFGNNKEIFAEDTFFQLCAISKMPKIEFVPIPLYNYDIRDSSLMTSYKEKLITRNISLLTYMYRYYEKNKLATYILDLELVNVIVLELLNTIENKKKFIEFKASMEEFRASDIYDKILRSMINNNSFKLEPNIRKRRINKFIFWFYLNKLNRVGDSIYYLMYRNLFIIRERKRG